MGHRYLLDLVRLFALLLLPHCTSCENITGSLSADTNQCVCTFNAPPVVVCTEYDAEYALKVDGVQHVIANLTTQMEDYKIALKRSEDRIMEFDERLSALMIMTETQPQDNKNNIFEIRRQLLVLEDLLDDVKEDNPDNEILQGIEYQIENITSVITKLTTDVVTTGEADWRMQAANVQEELDECKQKPTEFQRMLTVSQWPYKRAQDTCEKLSFILPPFTVRGSHGGVSPTLWFSDPLKDNMHIWLGTFDVRVCTVYYSSCGPGRGDHYEETRSELKRYNQTKLFENSSPNYVTYYMPHKIVETAIVAHNGNLFYVSYNTRTLNKFDVRANATVVTKELPADIGMSYIYTGRGDSAIDLEVDESGLWMIYATPANDGLIALSKLNTTNLNIIQTWYGNFPKKSFGNCFVSCGVLYCVSSHNSHNAIVNYYYDTKINKEGIMNVLFDSKYGDIKSLTYNPYDQKLYAIDNGHAVVYDLIFG